jgi:hypothetical protein
MANDEDLMDLFKEMQVSAAHRVEFKVAVAAWRADPQEVFLMCTPCISRAFYPCDMTNPVPPRPLSPPCVTPLRQALRVVERESAAAAAKAAAEAEEQVRHCNSQTHSQHPSSITHHASPITHHASRITRHSARDKRRMMNIVQEWGGVMVKKFTTNCWPN